MKLKRLNPDGMHMDYFASNGQQDIDDGHSDGIFVDPESPAVITINSSDIKPLSFKYLPENQGTKKYLNDIVQHGSIVQLCQIRIFLFREYLEAIQHFLFYPKRDIFVR